METRQTDFSLASGNYNTLTWLWRDRGVRIGGCFFFCSSWRIGISRGCGWFVVVRSCGISSVSGCYILGGGRIMFVSGCYILGGGRIMFVSGCWIHWGGRIMFVSGSCALWGGGFIFRGGCFWMYCNWSRVCRTVISTTQNNQCN